MSGPILSAHADQPHLTLIVNRKTQFFPPQDVFHEHPTGAFRGLMFAMLFNLTLGGCGVLAWYLWRCLH